MEHTTENSERQAEIINAIAVFLPMLDIEYCRSAAEEMKQQAHRQESMFVLNPSHPQAKNDILREQGKALGLLCGYVESLKKVESLKALLQKQQQSQDTINRLFI